MPETLTDIIRDRDDWEANAQQYEAENERLRAENADLREALRVCILHDRTPTYEYGEPNPHGLKPGQGQRWNTPREVARDTLKALSERGGDGS